VIVSASRRTDIPAFHSEWLMNRLRAGYVLVRNPISKNVVYRVDLSRSNVDCLVFITKNPMPMEDRLREISRMGHMFIMQVTLTPYGKDLEPGVPFKADINDCCIRIADRIGKDRMTWRYDPVILNGRIDMNYHRRKFEMMCREASEWTDRCIISFVDIYGKLHRLSDEGILRDVSSAEMREFARMASKAADEYGIVLTSCCEKEDLSEFGITSRPCLDPGTFRRLDIPYESSSYKTRERCGCVKCIDIGEYDTCLHNCVYCYANNRDPGRRLGKLYSDDSEMLWSSLTPRDQIVELSSREVSRIGDFFRSEDAAAVLRPYLGHTVIISDIQRRCAFPSRDSLHEHTRFG